MNTLWISLLALAFLPDGAHGQAAADYEVKLFRPAKAGDRYRVEARGALRREALVRDGAEARTEGLETHVIELTGEAEVLVADDKGNATATAIKVLSLVRVGPPQRDELLTPGVRIVERRVGSRQVFELDGKEVPPALREVLDMVLSETNDPAAPSDDELMGTKARKKIGERWPVNREALARLISGDADVALEVRPEDVEGSGVLTGAERCGDADCTRVEVSVTVAGAPRGAKVFSGAPETAKIDLQLSGLMPVDTRLDARQETTLFRMTFTRRFTEGGRERVAEAVLEQRLERKLAPIK